MCYISESMLFCTKCGNEGDPKYSLGPVSAILGMASLGFGIVVVLLSTVSGPPATGIFLFFGTIGAFFVTISYAGRRFFCPSCGSGDLIPADSPKAIEFKDRSRAFDHLQERRFPNLRDR